MKVLVLAAGRSNRMKPVSDKNFLNFLGKPLIQWQVEMIEKAGFDEVIVVGGAHNMDKLAMTLPGVKVVEQKNLDEGMRGAVLAGKDAVGDGSVLIFSSNDVVEQHAFELIKDSIDENVDGLLLGKKMTEYFPGGYLEVDGEGMVSSIIEKPGEGNEPSDMVNLVVHWHKDYQKLVSALESASSDQDDVYEVALDGMIKDGAKIKAVSYEGVWQPIKFPWHIHGVFKYLMSVSDKSVADSADISDKATVKGDVIIGENVRIFEGAVINGPVYLGDNTVVANNALVRDSHVGQNCVVGFNTEVARSYLSNKVWTHSNYIGDSVIGENVSFGAGTVTGNLRLDEGNIAVDVSGNIIDTKTNKVGLITGNNVRVGINTSLMPGVKVGNNCMVGAGIIIAQDIPDNSFARGSVELKVSPNNREIVDRDNF